MNNFQVAHKWANEAAPQGRGSNFYFHGGTLYSYGSHFVVGRIVRNKKGRRAYIMNCGTYSNSTSRHQSYAMRAIAVGETNFHVPDPSAGHAGVRESYKARMAAALANVPGARSARTLSEAAATAAAMAREYNEYSAFFSLRGRLKIPALSAADTARLARYQESANSREARETARWAAERAERERQEALTDSERREAFRNGAPRVGRIGGPCMLRYAQGLGRFETSQGADVPRADGLAMLRFIAGMLSAPNFGGASYDSDTAPSAGGFRLRSISREEVVIGCHHIPVSECALMAAEFAIEWPQS